MARFIAIFLVMCGIAFRVHAVDRKLDGWGDFKFGMSAEKARSIAGENAKFSDGYFSFDTTINEDQYRVNVLHRTGSVHEISLNEKEKHSRAVDCSVAWDKTFGFIKEKYGNPDSEPKIIHNRFVFQVNALFSFVNNARISASVYLSEGIPCYMRIAYIGPKKGGGQF